MNSQLDKTLFLIWMASMCILMSTVWNCALHAAEVKQQVRSCLACLKTYQACAKKVNQSVKPDEDAVLECEDKYYACFFKHTCQTEGQR